MNVFLTVPLLLCSLIIIILGGYLIVKKKLNPKIVGITILLLVCEVCLVFAVLYSLINKLYEVLGID
jgi:hypothetical protein